MLKAKIVGEIKNEPLVDINHVIEYKGVYAFVDPDLSNYRIVNMGNGKTIEFNVKTGSTWSTVDDKHWRSTHAKFRRTNEVVQFTFHPNQE